MNRNVNIRKGAPFGQTSFNPQMRPPPMRPTIINRTIIPSREYDPLIITQLLLKASTENNLLDLKKFIMENGITTSDMLNEEGQSILHLVLLNLNLSERQKLEFVRFLRDNGTLISSFDKLNQTPLHIACKLQLHDIVLELINAGHDINQIDSSYKTPLHYAVLGKSIETPDKVDKKIFPTKKIKFKSEEIPNIAKNLVEYIEKSTFLKQFFENQFNTFNMSHSIFKKQINDILTSTDVLDKVTTVLTNPSLDQETKNSKIFDITGDTNKKVKEFLNSQLNMSKKQLNMKPDTENGWGPDVFSSNKILEYDNIGDLKKLLYTNRESLLDKIKKTQIGLDTKTKSNIEDINNEIIKLQQLNKQLIFYHRVLFLINFVDNGAGIQKNKIDNIVFAEQIVIENFTYNMTNPIFDTLYYTGTLKKEDSFSCQYYNHRCIHTTGQRPLKKKIHNQEQIKTITFNPDPQINRTQYNEVIRLLTDFITDSEINRNYLLISRAMDYHLSINSPHQTLDLPPKPTYFLTRKLSGIASNLNTTSDNIQTQINNLVTNINNPKNVLEIISDTLVHILSFVNELPKYFKEYEKVITYYENILDIFKKKNVNKIGINLNGNRHRANALHDIAIIEIEYYLDKMRKNLEKDKIIFFNDLKKYYDLLSDCITYTNTNNACIFIEKYFNDFTNFDTIFTSTTSIISEIFKNPIEQLRPFFMSYDDIVKELIIDDDQQNQKKNKRKLVEKYLLQLTPKYNYIYISNPAIDEVDLSKIGYLTGTIKLLDLDIDIDQLQLRSGNEEIIDVMEVADASKEGIITIIREKQLNKKDRIFDVVGILFDNFVMFQKYFITRKILNDLYKFIIKNPPEAIPTGNPIAKLKEDIDRLKIEIKNNIKNADEDNSIILIILGKIIDKIFNANLENILTITTNNYVFNYVSKPTDTEYSLINISNFNKVDLSNIDFNQIDKDIYRLIKGDNLTKGHKSLELYHTAEDLMKKIPKTNTYKLMSSTIGDDPSQLYMQFDIKLIELLIKNGADVNSKDKDGNTSLSVAILQSNQEVVKYFIDNTQISVNTHKSKNRFGYKPLDIAVKTVNNNIQNFNTETDDKSLDQMVKEIDTEIMKLTKINHNMRYHDIIIKMLLYLINHNFYSKINNYSGNKISKISHDEIFNHLTSQLSKLPLLSNIDKIPMSYHKLIQSTFDTKIIETRNKIYDELSLIGTLSKLKQEAKSFPTEYKDKTQEQKYRTKEIQQVNNKIGTPPPNTDPMYKRLNKIKGIMNDDNNTNNRLINWIKNLKHDISSYPLEMYIDISTKILEYNKNDYRTYTILWDNLLKHPKNNSDPTQIINKILEKINLNSQDIKIINLCNKALHVLNFDIDNYFTLPTDYNDINIPLNEILEIIIHIVKTTMIVNLYHTIIKLLRSELMVKIPKTTDDIKYHQDIDKKIDNIMSQNVGNINIKDYLFEILPEKLVKVSLGIYENDEDYDRNTQIITLLTYIDTILTSTSEFALINVDESKTLKILSQNVYPYFKNYFEINIKKMKKISDGYLSMILNLSTKLNILEIVLQKAKTEK